MSSGLSKKVECGIADFDRKNDANFSESLMDDGWISITLSNIIILSVDSLSFHLTPPDEAPP